MSIETHDLVEYIVNNNNDVDEVLEALCVDWEVQSRLYDLYPEDMKEAVFDNMNTDEVLEYEVSEVGVELILEYFLENHIKELKKFIEDSKTIMELKE